MHDTCFVISSDPYIVSNKKTTDTWQEVKEKIMLEILRSEAKDLLPAQRLFDLEARLDVKFKSEDVMGDGGPGR